MTVLDIVVAFGPIEMEELTKDDVLESTYEHGQAVTIRRLRKVFNDLDRRMNVERLKSVEESPAFSNGILLYQMELRHALEAVIDFEENGKAAHYTS